MQGLMQHSSPTCSALSLASTAALQQLQQKQQQLSTHTPPAPTPHCLQPCPPHKADATTLSAPFSLLYCVLSPTASCRYVDASGAVTETYPANPNGSPAGIAGLCSADGRHLAMMPHPERCFLGWQLPWAPADAGIDPRGAGPWLRLFQNAREWAETGAAQE